MLDDALHGLYLIQRCGLGGLLESKEVADEDRLFLLVYHLCPLLELLVRTQSCGNLQIGNGIGVPGMQNAVLTP